MMWKETHRIPWRLHWLVIVNVTCIAVYSWVFDTQAAGLGWTIAALAMSLAYVSDMMDAAQNKLIDAQRDALRSLGFYDEVKQ